MPVTTARSASLPPRPLVAEAAATALVRWSDRPGVEPT